jgi:hypothetical protein
MDKLEEQVHLAIGRASMCWSEIPTGAYNDQQASKIATDLIAYIREYMLKARLTEDLSKKPGTRKKPKSIPLDWLEDDE